MNRLKLLNVGGHFFPVWLYLLLLFYGCGSGDRTTSIMITKHEVEIRKQGLGMIYLDNVSCDFVLQTMDSTNGNNFMCIKVGFVDSSITSNEKEHREKGKYFQYDMYKDWRVIQNGDSIAPVFFQPLFKKNQQIDEGVIVFEMAKDLVPDTLVYNDSFGSWNTQIIPLTGK